MKKTKKTKRVLKDDIGMGGYRATCECENCGHKQDIECDGAKSWFEKYIIPNTKCQKCKKSSVALGNRPSKNLMPRVRGITKYKENK
jgi:hypothetical protein